ncbi:C-type natriuretic peptide 1-like [Spea bombifrons]|uniref:C-type natriuretic peptide 1-like n=1 Tax=Spea bombifrons TaxID=233779 RepID=UPI00234A59ED|nr:C-type natriuretic peptide 1-like [Spea bombifrons]
MKRRTVTCLSLLMVLMLRSDYVRGKPISSLQSLSRLLENNFEQPFGSEEAEHERGEPDPADSADQQSLDLQRAKNRVDPGENARLGDMTLEQFLADPLGFSKGYRLRSKKGLSRGCFGVKLDRIGSLSGLGC